MLSCEIWDIQRFGYGMIPLYTLRRVFEKKKHGLKRMALYNASGCCMGLKCYMYIKDVDRLCRLEYAAFSLCVVFGKKIFTGRKELHVLNC